MKALSFSLGSHTHSVLCLDGGSTVDQVLNTVEVSWPHRNKERGAIQLETGEQGFLNHTWVVKTGPGNWRTLTIPHLKGKGHTWWPLWTVEQGVIIWIIIFLNNTKPLFIHLWHLRWWVLFSSAGVSLVPWHHAKWSIFFTCHWSWTEECHIHFTVSYIWNNNKTIILKHLLQQTCQIML